MKTEQFKRKQFVYLRQNINLIGVVVDIITIAGQALYDVEFDGDHLLRLKPTQIGHATFRSS